MSASTDTVSYQRFLRWKFWSVFQVAIPCFFIFILWPIGQGLYGIPHAFEKTFGGADLLLMGAMLLLSMMVDLYYEQRSNEKLKAVSSIDNQFIVDLCFGLLFLFVYGFIKAKSMQYEFPVSTADALGREIRICVFASIGGGVFAILWSILSTHKSMVKILEAEKGSPL